MSEATPNQIERLAFNSISKRPRLRWSNGARVAVWVIPNIEYFHITGHGASIRQNPVPMKPDIPNHSWREYGPRVGVWRLMELMDRFRVPGTVALNAAVCDHYPEILEEARRLEWEFMGHGWTNAESLTGLSEDGERALIRRVRDRMKAYFGVAPRGWLSPALNENWATPDLLKEEGYAYTCDQPALARHDHALPAGINDPPAFLARHASPEDFCRRSARSSTSSRGRRKPGLRDGDRAAPVARARRAAPHQAPRMPLWYLQDAVASGLQAGEIADDFRLSGRLRFRGCRGKTA
jgi:peptidoglycan/xylan/chitin deacetylase (PgdA/CDA1 family)